MVFSNKRPVESFLVAKLGQTTMPSSGTLSNTSTGVVNLADGQLGLISSSIFGTTAMNAFLDASPTLTEAPVFSIVQGTPDSANPAATPVYPLSIRPYEISGPIDGRRPLTVTKQVYRDPVHDIVMIGNTIGSAGQVNVLSKTLYEVAIGFRGRREAEFYSSQEASYLRSSFTSPDFSSAGLNLSNTLAVDYILTYIGWNIDLNSSAFRVNNRVPNKMPIVAFGIDTTGTTGTAIGGGTGLAAGAVIPVVVASSGTKNITLTAAMAASINAAAVAFEGVAIASVVSKIVAIDLASAGSASGGTINSLLLMALDEPISLDDRIPQVKVTIDTSLAAGFDYTSVRNKKYTFADEGQGIARQLEILYQDTAGQRKYNTWHTDWPITAYPSPILSTEKYTVYNFLNATSKYVDTANVVDSPMRAIVCVPAYSSGVTTNPLVTAFDALLASYMTSVASTVLVYN